MALAANAITSVANVQAYPGANSAWTTANIEAAIDRVSKFIENYCNCNFINTTYTSEKQDGDGTRHIYTDHSPIVSVTSVTDTPTTGTAVTYTVATELIVYGDEGRITIATDATSGSAFGNDDQNVAITYVAGYGAAIANLPPDIVEAATRMAVNLLSSGDASEISSEKIGDYSVSYDVSKESVGDIISILDLYRRPAIG